MSPSGPPPGAPPAAPAPGDPALPPPLARIRADALAFQRQEPERARTAADWVRRAARIRAGVPAACVEDGGETIRIGGLSPGCAACKAGRMDCIFVTAQCNLSCAFCMCPQGWAGPPLYSALARDPSALAGLYDRLGITGVAFTGGEPLLDPDSVLRGVAFLRAGLPSLYIWIETNGLLLSADLIGRLADAGLDEIRVNAAATGYGDPRIEGMLREAARRVPAVAVEAPTVPADADRCLDSLRRWVDAGVRYLNLHELVYEPGSNSESLPGERLPVTMPDGHRCAVDPRSTAFVERVLARVAGEGLPLAVNDCSLCTKAGQMRGRRRLVAPLVLRPHERLRADGLAESDCRFTADRVEWVVAEPGGAAPRPAGAARTAVVRRQLPLAVGHPGHWVYCAFADESHGTI